MQNMTDNNIYIETVCKIYPNTTKKCRPAIAQLRQQNKNVSIYGFVIGDSVEDSYFINQKTLDIYKKSDCTLINYIDGFDD